jgi:hypothetical protein
LAYVAGTDMDDLTFWSKIAEVLGSLAWPALLVTVLIVYRRHVAGLFGRLQEFSLGGAKAVFEKELEKAGEKAEEIEPEGAHQPPPVPTADDPYLFLAKNFPEAAVMQEYKEIEALLNEGTQDMPVSRMSDRINVSKAARWLLDDNAYQLFLSLREARNAAAHARASNGISPSEALEYRDRAQVLKQVLRRAIDERKRQ